MVAVHKDPFANLCQPLPAYANLCQPMPAYASLCQPTPHPLFFRQEAVPYVGRHAVARTVSRAWSRSFRKKKIVYFL